MNYGLGGGMALRKLRNLLQNIVQKIGPGPSVHRGVTLDLVEVFWR